MIGLESSTVPSLPFYLTSWPGYRIFHVSSGFLSALVGLVRTPRSGTGGVFSSFSMGPVYTHCIGVSLLEFVEGIGRAYFTQSYREVPVI